MILATLLLALAPDCSFDPADFPCPEVECLNGATPTVQLCIAAACTEYAERRAANATLHCLMYEAVRAEWKKCKKSGGNLVECALIALQGFQDADNLKATLDAQAANDFHSTAADCCDPPVYLPPFLQAQL